MTEDATITIPLSVWHEFKKDQVYLRCLEMAGVDNWEDGGSTFEHMKEYFPEEYKLYFRY